MWFLFAQVMGLPLVPGCFTQKHGDPTQPRAAEGRGHKSADGGE